MADATNEQASTVESFNMEDKEESHTAGSVMATALAKPDQGVVIVDSPPGKQSIIQNVNSDTSKTVS